MISLIIVGLAFIWLGYETNWMRVRLFVGIAIKTGACCDWKLSDSRVTDIMKRKLYDLSFGKARRSWGEFKDWIEPLCGWGYAYQYKDFKPEYRIELISEHAKYTMRTESVSILRDAFKVYRNPWLKVKLA